MTKKEQRRLTDERLAKAAFKLLKGRALEDIAVGDICLEAGVKRVTFYSHFPTKDDFFCHIFADRIEAEFKSLDFREGRSAALSEAVASFNEKNKEALRNLASSRYAFLLCMESLKEALAREFQSDYEIDGYDFCLLSGAIVNMAFNSFVDKRLSDPTVIRGKIKALLDFYLG